MGDNQSELKSRICPRCGDENVKPIIYGLPTQDMTRAQTFELGGCAVHADSPDFTCLSCGHAWAKRADAASFADVEPIPLKVCGTGGLGHTGPGYSSRDWGRGKREERSGVVVAIEGEVVTINWSNGETSRFRQHQTERLRDLLAKCGDAVLLQGNVLAVPCAYTDEDGLERRSHFLMSVAPDTGLPLERCIEPSDEHEVRRRDPQRDPWIADLHGEEPTGCQSTVGFDDFSCTEIPDWYVELEVLEYEVANPRWEGKLCGSCLLGWQQWARDEPTSIRVLSVTAIVDEECEPEELA